MLGKRGFVMVWLLLAELAYSQLIEPVKPDYLKHLSEQVATMVYRYDYHNYRHSFDKLNHYFTPEGWRKFQVALAISHNVDFVKKHRMHVDGVILQKARLVKQLKEDEWLYRVKMRVNFKGPRTRRRNDLWVWLQLKRYQDKTGHVHVGVKKVVAYPTNLDRAFV